MKTLYQMNVPCTESHHPQNADKFREFILRIDTHDTHASPWRSLPCDDI